MVTMLIGFNTNVPYKGKVYHVQTEDSGLANPYIVTLLYYQGAILCSVKTGYAHIVEQPDFEERLRDLMKRQHREMIRALIKGKCSIETPGIGAVAPSSSDEEKGIKAGTRKDKAKVRARSLDEILLEHISRKVKK